MNSTRVSPVLLSALVLASLAPASAVGDSAAFWAFIAQVEQLEERRQYQEAVSALEKARRQFPGREHEIDWELSAVYAQSGERQKSMDIWRKAHTEGRFFGLNIRWEWLRAFRELPEFNSLADRDKELAEAAARTAVMRYEVDQPANYAPTRKYPLFIVLHGGADSIDHARTYWRSRTLSQAYLVAFIQSALPVSSKTYGWRGRDPDARTGIRKLYDEIVKKYPVDPGRVYIGGMSAGGMMALDVAFHDVIPLAGFIANCPVVPPDFEPGMARQLQQRGVKGAVITGEKDFAIAQQKEMIDAFAKAGVAHQFTILDGMGHEIPKDFSARVDAALEQIGPTLSAGARSLSITLVSNEGFLLSAGGKKVMIDALFSGQDQPYGDFPSSELIGTLEQARPPFDGVSLLLATHSHDDHFVARNVAAHLSQNPAATFLSTRDAVGQVRGIAPELETMGRIRAVCPEKMHTSQTVNVDGFRVDALRVDHGVPNFEDLAFLVRWNGLSALHTGDSMPDDYRAFPWDGAGIDVVFVNPGYFHDSIERGVDLVKNVIKARNVVLMHYKLNRDLDRIERLAADLRPRFQPGQVLVFSKPMQTMTLSLAPSTPARQPRQP